MLKVKNRTMAFEHSRELERVAEWYSMPLGRRDPDLEELKPFLDDYLELTFQPNRFEVIAGGSGVEASEVFCRVAARRGLSGSVVEAFRAACVAFPGSYLGIKLPFEMGRAVPPTLYVRSKCEKERVFSFLLDAGIRSSVLRELSDALSDNDYCYGLGLTDLGGEVMIKTYSLDRVRIEGSNQIGFKSYRLSMDEMVPAWKEYLPDTPIDQFDPPSSEWDELIRFLTVKMRFHIAGHIGYERGIDGISHPKIYVERRGGIPTDFSAR